MTQVTPRTLSVLATIMATLGPHGSSAAATATPDERRVDRRPGSNADAYPFGTLTATLINPGATAPQQTATVQVTVSGIQLVDPAVAHEQPRTGQGHLHYRLDDGPIIATTATSLSFQELSPGTHTILVRLTGNDHRPLGPEQLLQVSVPTATTQPRPQLGG